jgi:transcriptional regulator with XRE-family HTH domain
VGVAEDEADKAGRAIERVTIAEAAALLGCHPNTVRSRLKAGMYRAEKIDTENGLTWMIERDSLSTGDPQEVSGSDGPVGEPEPPVKGGGLPLPGLKHWRLRRGISQTDLARRSGLGSDYLFKVESGRRACRPQAAELLADLLGVDLVVLRRKPGAAFDMETSPKPDRPRVAYRHVHQDYMRITLEGAVGSAYAAMDEREVEERCEESTWEGALEIVQARKQEIEYLRDALGAAGVLSNPDLSNDVRAFLVWVLDSFPDLDIHLLAMARRREPTEEGHQALTKAMRDLL